MICLPYVPLVDWVVSNNDSNTLQKVYTSFESEDAKAQFILDALKTCPGHNIVLDITKLEDQTILIAINNIPKDQKALVVDLCETLDLLYSKHTS